MKTGRTETYYLYPGEVYVGTDYQFVTTVLGSCVSVCIYDTRLHLGGMNHFMLPLWNGDGLESPKYGDIAILQLFDKLMLMGSRKEDLICKIFGGAEIIGENQSFYRVGKRNIDLACRLVGELGVPLVSSSTGGNSGRKIFFNTSSGEVFQKYLIKTKNEA